jgi:hypothetical protein
MAICPRDRNITFVIRVCCTKLLMGVKSDYWYEYVGVRYLLLAVSLDGRSINIHSKRPPCVS